MKTSHLTKKDIMTIVAGHHVPYAASACVAYPADMLRKMRRAVATGAGFRFLHLLSPCPPGWKIPSELTVKLSRLAVRTRIFPLYEIEDGKYAIQEDCMKDRVPMQEYLRLQGRFSHLKNQEVESIQRMVDEQWERLQKRAKC